MTRQDGLRGMNDIGCHLALFKDFKPFAGFVPKGFLVDFLGCFTDANFRAMWAKIPTRPEVGR